MLTLWTAPATCSLLPHILLAESGLDYEIEAIDFMKTGVDPRVKAMNPKGRIPVLVFEDGTVLTETVAITTRISQLAPQHHFLGKTDLDVCRSYEWFNWLSGTLHERGFGIYFQPQKVCDEPASYKSIRRISREFIEQCYADIEEKLQGVHAVGEAFSAVDVFLYVIYRWGNLLKLDMESRYPKYARLVEEVTKRPKVVETVEKEGIPLIKDGRMDGIDIESL